ncbi:hypothetical protein ASD11_12320 [Aeromicrobium sp. Root495]|uniref:hypothetical protein n=1 Tax=Aeromicrobium sp. Root495 TaxID=1736550 RepID=UPI0007013930|nr:hypothetical protein [Aeromicrobium sp. Root495]KQY60245.1 hypothetical protein ASD11_12320 [Aeromicrobium sp. Root495]
MAYTQLPIIDVSVDALRLDLDNYRIPIRPNDELAALRYLFAAEEVVSQVKLFLRDGYFDNEVPIVVEEDGANIVLEGNRRVSALKAVQDPTLVPEHEADVRALLTRYAAEVPNMPTVIRVIVAPSREAARPHIARLHTGVPKKRWSRDQQANYYHSILSPKVDVEDLKGMYPDVNIVRFLRMVEMRHFLDGVKFKDKTLHDYARGDDLKMSAFEYAYRIVDVAAAIGVVFDGYRISPARRKAKTIGAGLSTRERDAVEYLMQRFRAETLNTRSSEFKKGHEHRDDLIKTLLAGGQTPTPDDLDAQNGRDLEEPDLDGPGGSGDEEPDDRGDADVEDNGNWSERDDPPPPDDGAGGKRGRNNPDTLRGFDISSLPDAGIPTNLARRIIELRAINVRKTPVATAMLLRLVLESSIKYHFSGTTHAVSGQLKQAVDELHTVYGSKAAHRDVINAIRSGPVTTPGSQNWFNAAAHNPDYTVREADVRQAYSLSESILRLMLVRFQP